MNQQITFEGITGNGTIQIQMILETEEWDALKDVPFFKVVKLLVKQGSAQIEIDQKPLKSLVESSKTDYIPDTSQSKNQIREDGYYSIELDSKLEGTNENRVLLVRFNKSFHSFEERFSLSQLIYSHMNNEVASSALSAQKSKINPRFEGVDLDRAKQKFGKRLIKTKIFKFDLDRSRKSNASKKQLHKDV